MALIGGRACLFGVNLTATRTPFHHETSRRNRPGTVRFLRSASPVQPHESQPSAHVDAPSSPW